MCSNYDTSIFHFGNLPDQIGNRVCLAKNKYVYFLTNLYVRKLKKMKENSEEE